MFQTNQESESSQPLGLTGGISNSSQKQNSGIITGAGGQADELAHMIENENQRLREKNQ